MATRLYFATAAPAISPTPHTQWNIGSPYNYGSLVFSASNTTFEEKSKGRGSGSTVQVPQIILVSEALATGTSFSTTDTFKAVARTREGTTSHDASSCISIRIVDGSGNERSVLYTENIIGSGNVGEWSTSLQNAKFPRSASDDTGTALQSNYTTVSGDRLEVTLGSRISGSFGVGIVEIGDPISSTDLVHNASSSTQNRPWIEFSNNFSLPIQSRTKVKSAGSFSTKVRKEKSGGSWQTRAIKRRSGGNFS